jgi:predicted nucleotidyltransferase
MPGPPPLSNDLKELIGLFQSHGVEFLVVGAHALALHSRPRFTEDLDLFLRNSRENAERLKSALVEFGIGMRDEAVEQFETGERSIIVLGNKPAQVDLLNFLDGVDFQEAWDRKVTGNLGGHIVSFIGLEDYITTKRASGRPRDLADLQHLRDHLGKALPGD